MVTFSPLGTSNVTTITSLTNLRTQLDDANTQLATGVVSTTYGGLGDQRGLDVSSRAKLAEIEGYRETNAFLDVRFTLYDTTLQRMSDLNATVKAGSDPNLFDVSSDGRTTGSITAEIALREMLGLVSTDDGGRYLYSGRASDTPPVASYDEIMEGTGTRDGFETVLDERKQADLGPDQTVTVDGVATQIKTGRLNVSHTATELTLAETTNAFGFQLAGVTTNINGVYTTTTPTPATFTPPAVAHDTLTVDLSANPPAIGDEITFSYLLPNGEETNVTLTGVAPDSDDLNDLDGSATDQVSFTETQAANVGVNNIVELSAADLAGLSEGESITITDPSVNGGQPQVFTFAEGADGNSFNQFSDLTSLVTAMTSQGLTAADVGGNLQITSNQPGQALTTSVTTYQEDGNFDHQFVVDPAGLEATLENIEATLLQSLNTLAVTELAAGSAHRASEDFFFDETSPDQAPTRVVVPPGGSAADALETTTDTLNTVLWYQGDRDTSITSRQGVRTKIDPNITLDYAARANEVGIASDIRNMAVLATERFDPLVETDSDRYKSLAVTARTNLVVEPGDPSISQMQAEFAIKHSAVNQAELRHRALSDTYLTFIQDIEGIDTTEVAARVVTLETQLQASYEVTSQILNLSLLNYI